MANLIIECVCYNSKRDFNKFIKKIDSQCIKIIDYSIIKNKLMKADPYENEPHDSIIGLNIIKMIKDCFNNKQPEILVYSFYNLEVETIVNFKELIDSHTISEYTLVLNILNMNTVPPKNVLNKFDCVKFIDND